MNSALRKLTVRGFCGNFFPTSVAAECGPKAFRIVAKSLSDESI